MLWKTKTNTCRELSSASCCLVLLLAALLSGGSIVGCGNSPGEANDARDSDDSETTTSPSWEVVVEGSDKGAFFNVWGRSHDDVYVAGGTEQQGVLLHYDGTSWTEVPLPSDTPLLTWTFGIGDALWVVGYEGTVLYRANDEAPWEEQAIGTSEPLWGIWGADKDSLWTVGGDASPEAPSEGIVFSWNGNQWSEQLPPPSTEEVIDAFYKVWGTSQDNVYVVGAKGRILHWNGESWTGSDTQPYKDLVSLWGAGPQHIFISGGRAQGVLLRKKDDGWERLNTQSLSSPGLNGTWVEPSGNAGYSVGVSGTILRFTADSTSTGTNITRQPTPTSRSLHGVWGTDDGSTIFAVGGNLAADELSEGIILMRRNEL